MGVILIERKLYVILGNGFTIDFISKVFPDSGIDVTNLFKCGDKVKWLSDGNPGFLSYRRCPNLWNLGARPGMEKKLATNLIEEIITCANVYAYANSKGGASKFNSDNIYVKAYKELVMYLKFLFIGYNNKITQSKFSDALGKSNWGWKTFMQKFGTSVAPYSKVTFVTYNYDIWLERILDFLNIEYNIKGFDENNNSLVEIIKPHGSISFRSERVLDKSSFEINYSRDILAGPLKELKVDCRELEVNSTLNAMIPPAGDSSRYKSSWSNEMQEFAKSRAKDLIQNDDVIMCGISYWHVDRLELDDLFLNMDEDVNFRVINPNLPAALNAVLSSLFKNYTVYSDSDILGGIL